MQISARTGLPVQNMILIPYYNLYSTQNKDVNRMLYGKPVYKTIMIGTYNDTLISIYDYPYE